jgi:hypothetical protein
VDRDDIDAGAAVVAFELVLERGGESASPRCHFQPQQVVLNDEVAVMVTPEAAPTSPYAIATVAEDLTIDDDLCGVPTLSDSA